MILLYLNMDLHVLFVGTRSPLLNTKALLPYFTFNPNVLAKAKLTKQCDVALSIVTNASICATCHEKVTLVKMTKRVHSKYVAWPHPYILAINFNYIQIDATI